MERQDFTISEFYWPFINRLIALIPRLTLTFSFRVDSLLFFCYTFVIQYAIFRFENVIWIKLKTENVLLG